MAAWTVGCNASGDFDKLASLKGVSHIKLRVIEKKIYNKTKFMGKHKHMSNHNARSVLLACTSAT